MSVKVFITGATGYIGGDALSLISERHPEWELTCLVRNSDKGAKVASQYARARLVYGDLDKVELIEEEASKADIVYHFADCDHVPSAKAIAKGLARREESKPGYWIHTSGSLILGLETIENNLFGEETSKVFNDWDGIQDLTSIPHQSPHRNVDEIVLSASVGHENVKTAIVCPPTIYGVGRGPDNQRSIQVPMAVTAFLQKGKAFMVRNGHNIWHQVHVHDLSNLYLLLGEAAVAGGPPATWNDQGYYLAENGNFKWGDILQAAAKSAHKKNLLPSAEVLSLTPDDILAEPDGGKFVFALGSNSRGEALRAKKLLGWAPKGKSLMAEVPKIVDSEARRLGLTKGHAETVEED